MVDKVTDEVESEEISVTHSVSDTSLNACPKK